jgi:DNA topoisomerase-1
MLGNTRSVCRKYYIHPALIEAYLEGSVLPPQPARSWSPRAAEPRPSDGPRLRQHEAEVLAFIKARIKPRMPAKNAPQPAEPELEEALT